LSTKSLEFQFLHYEPIYSNLKVSYDGYSKLYNEFKEAGDDNVAFKVLSYFYAGMLYVVKGDEVFGKGKKDDARINYEEALKLLVRARASRGREGDRIFNEMVKWINYSEGMYRICTSYLEEDLGKQISAAQEAVKFFEDFAENRKIEENKIDISVSQARISFAKYVHELKQSESMPENTKFAKKHLLTARTELMKANFMFKTLDDEMENLQNKIDEITKLHIVGRAEWFWDQGTQNIVVSNFNEALRFFAIASKYYARASVICANFMEQRLYLALSRITQASQLESEANELYKRRDNPIDASSKFKEAVESVDIALGLLSSIKSESLIMNMTAQRSFYEALSLETEGIALFDQEKFKEALAKFEEAMKRLEETQISASEGNLEQLLEFVRTSKSEVEGYISMAQAMAI
jgi:predicted negative regulator of RcsB-dependent stress response